MTTPTPGHLEAQEPHPCSKMALEIIYSRPSHELLLLREAFASCAIENNRLAQICGETLRRLLNNEPVSDRYLMGLAIYITRTTP